MTDLRYHDKSPCWRDDSVEDRLRTCLIFLKNCEILTDIELSQLSKRIDENIHEEEGKRS